MVSQRESISRRGAALLLVLAVLVITTSTVVPLLRLALTARAARNLTTNRQECDQLLVEAEQAAIAWLAQRSASVTLPWHAPLPSLTILDDQWIYDGVKYALRLTAFDQCGMVPLDSGGRDSPLILSLPPDVAAWLESLDSSSLVGTVRSGLDQWQTLAPRPIAPATPTDEPPALAALISTHAPTSSDTPINVNTAPRALVAAAVISAGRGGLDAIAEARRAGRWFSPSAASPAADSSAHRRAVLVASSTAWAIRIDILCGQTRRSWWSVYVLHGSVWERAQRLAITE